jgi:hypothetical protein
LNKAVWFLKDYCERHRHPLNAVLHLIGVPQVFFGLYQLVTGRWQWGLFNIFVGYALQTVGHLVFQKNEVGEVILITHLIAKLLRR